MTLETDPRPRDAVDADRIVSFGREFGESADLRRRFESDPRAVLEERGFDVATDVELRVTSNTDDVYYFAMPPDPNETLADESLGPVAGGTTSSTASSVTSAATIGCSTAPSTLSSVGSLGCAGSAE